MMITQQYLKSILKYDPETGLFTWTVNISRKMRSGSIAGWKNHTGYIYIRINGKDCLSHRLACLYMTGSFPKEQIDHINGKKDGNRWVNLRESTNRQNQFNTTAQKNNSIGIKGVCIHRGRFMAQTRWNGKQKYLGLYDTPEEASQVYQDFAMKNHGEFYQRKNHERRP